MKFRIIFLLLLSVAVNVANGQDQIVKRNGEIINAKVKEIGTSEIKYVQEEINKDVLFSMILCWLIKSSSPMARNT